MSDAQFAAWLRSIRTTTQDDVDKITRDHDRDHMSASDRLDMVTHCTPLGGSEH